ncbi:unnamed protein product, partial [Porites evermanni]
RLSEDEIAEFLTKSERRKSKIRKVYYSVDQARLNGTVNVSEETTTCKFCPKGYFIHNRAIECRKNARKLKTSTDDDDDADDDDDSDDDDDDDDAVNNDDHHVNDDHGYIMRKRTIF